MLSFDRSGGPLLCLNMVRAPAAVPSPMRLTAGAAGHKRGTGQEARRRAEASIRSEGSERSDGKLSGARHASLLVMREVSPT